MGGIAEARDQCVELFWTETALDKLILFTLTTSGRVVHLQRVNTSVKKRPGRSVSQLAKVSVDP